MKTTTRFLTAGLASLAVASAVTLTGGASAYAADAPERPCGQPAVPAIYLPTPSPVVRPVDAVTHEVWLWQHDVTTTEREYSRVITPAGSQTVDLTREVDGTTGFRWSHRVVTQAATPALPGTPEESHVDTVVVSPAVTLTEFEYVQKNHPDMTRWENDGWNGDKGDEDKGQGWAKTGNSRVTELSPEVTSQVTVVTRAATDGTPALPEVSHLEETWAAVPGGDDWTKVQHSVTTPQVVDTLWAFEAPAGYTPTGLSRDQTRTEQTDVASADAPAGDGWTKVPESGSIVVDREATTEIPLPVGEHVLVSAAVPASPACPLAAPSTDASAPGSVAVAAAKGPAAHTGTHVAAPSAVHAAAASHVATTLPSTGNPVSPLQLGTSLGALLAGGVLVQVGRRRHS